MTTFDNRDKGFESKFAHDEELNFKAASLCHRMAGMWAAGLMGKTGTEAEAYARSIIEAGFENSGEAALEAHLLADFTKAGLAISAREIRKEIARLMPLARRQVSGHSD